MSIELAVAAVLGLAAGAGLGWWLTRTRMGVALLVLEERGLTRETRIRELGDELLATHDKFERQLQARETEASHLQLQLRDLDSKLAASETQLREERRQWEAKTALLNEAERKLGDAFKTLSAEVFKSSNQSFLDLAQETLAKFHLQNQGDLKQREQAVQALVEPIAKSLDKVEQQIQLVEKSRAQAYGSLTEHLSFVTQGQDRLRTETGNLVKALRAPQARGRWGEIQLQRVCEMAGMIEHCDFEQQASVNTQDGKLRPDMVVRLPGGRRIVVDAKAPLSAYLEALEAPDDAGRAQKLKEHAQQVRTHLAKLSAKQYWSQFQPAPEFVVLFLPGESFFSAALQEDPSLIEEGVNQQVIVATPTTLIALLKAVAFGWNQERINQENQKIAALGNELYERVRKFAEHIVRVGSGLNTAVDGYNKAVASLETRVLVSARRFKEFGAATGEDIAEIDLLQVVTRSVESPDLMTRAPAIAAPAAEAKAVAPAAPAIKPAPQSDERAVAAGALPAEATTANAAGVSEETSPAAAESSSPADAGADAASVAARGASRKRHPMDRLLAAMGRTVRPEAGAPPMRPAAAPVETMPAAILPEMPPAMEEPPIARVESAAVEPASAESASAAPSAVDSAVVEPAVLESSAVESGAVELASTELAVIERAIVELPPQAGHDAFPELDEVLAAPLPDVETSMEEIMAIVGDDLEPAAPATNSQNP